MYLSPQLIQHQKKTTTTKSVDCENKVKVRWYMSGWHVHTMINMWTKYGDPMLYGNRETDLITKTYIVNASTTVTVTRKATPMSRLKQLSWQARQKTQAEKNIFKQELGNFFSLVRWSAERLHQITAGFVQIFDNTNLLIHCI